MTQPDDDVQDVRRHLDAIAAVVEATEEKQATLEEARVAADELLRRVHTLEETVAEAQAMLLERARQTADAVGAAAEPLIAGLRARAEGLAADASAGPAPRASPEEVAEDDGEAPEPEGTAGAESAEPSASGDDGLAPGDAEDALGALDDEDDHAPAASGRERARLVAVGLALGGATREHVADRLRDQIDAGELEGVLDEAFGEAEAIG